MYIFPLLSFKTAFFLIVALFKIMYLYFLISFKILFLLSEFVLLWYGNLRWLSFTHPVIVQESFLKREMILIGF